VFLAPYVFSKVILGTEPLEGVERRLNSSGRFYVRSERGISGKGTVIEVSLPEECKVNLRIYDISGRLVAEPIDGVMNAGVHKIRWDSETPGVYLYRLEAGERTATGKIILVR
ncbi:hypothetical protein DRQ18_06065, partial [bacterium]